jgi:ubiquinone/menaquinone biosynthesis C-methylase UbiE
MSLIAWLDTLQSPEDGAPLVAALDAGGHSLRRANGDPVRANENIVRLVWPARAEGRDATWNRFYDRLAPFYDWNERLGGRLFGVHALRERAAIVNRLGLQPGMRVLEVSPGPGVYQELLAQRIGPSGSLAELDLSIGMLRACARRARKSGLDPLLVQANAAYLPFADDSFDAVFHFGGVKLFSEPRRALAEFVRVARPGALVAWGDEGFGTGAPTGFRRRLLERVNPGFLEPMPPLPDGLDGDGPEAVHEVMNGCAWLVVARKAAGVPAAPATAKVFGYGGRAASE